MERGHITFRGGESALLIDRKGRQYMVSLRTDGVFHTHLGFLPHTDIIGREQGSWVRTSLGHTLLALKPTLGEYVQHMPRSAQVIYAKDLGLILMAADVFPGARVVEAGLGSGALTLALGQAVGAQGCVITYEIRAELVDRTLANIGLFLPEMAQVQVKTADIYQGIQERDLDRVVLDVPEPWEVVRSAADVLKPGGIFLSFLPTVLQVHRLTQALEADGRFQRVETSETLQRPWHVTGQSVRPVHRMVAHSGFITTARCCQPRPTFGGTETGPSPEVNHGQAEDS